MVIPVVTEQDPFDRANSLISNSDRVVYIYGKFEAKASLFIVVAESDFRQSNHREGLGGCQGGGRPTEEQAEAITDLASAVHQFVVSQIRDGGVLSV